MGDRMAGKVALVTGSTRGIGRAIASMFAAEGAKVVITGRNEENGHAVEAQIRERGGEAAFVRTDVGCEEDVQRAVQFALDSYGELTTLVNNAAPTELVATLDRSVVDLDTASWDELIRLMLTSVFWCSKHAVPRIVEAGGGAVVNISSDAALQGITGVDAYTAAKGAMNSLTRSMAVEFGRQGVRVNTVVVGFVPGDSPAANALAEHPVAGPMFRAAHLTRLGRPEDVAYAVTWLACDEAEFVSGALVPVDGGATAKAGLPDVKSPEILQALLAAERAHADG